MPTARWKFAATSSGNCLYAIGGSGNNSDVLGIVESFCVENSTWNILPSLPMARVSLAASSLKYILYVSGGWNLTNGRFKAVQNFDAYNIEEKNGIPSLLFHLLVHFMHLLRVTIQSI